MHDLVRFWIAWGRRAAKRRLKYEKPRAARLSVELFYIHYNGRSGMISGSFPAWKLLIR
jgi:hypothetical protein